MELDSLKYLAKALMNYIDGKFEDYFKEITWQYTKNGIKWI